MTPLFAYTLVLTCPVHLAHNSQICVFPHKKPFPLMSLSWLRIWLVTIFLWCRIKSWTFSTLYNLVLSYMPNGIITIFGLTSVLSDISIGTPYSFGFHLHEVSFSSLHSEPMCVSSKLKWVSVKYHIYLFVCLLFKSIQPLYAIWLENSIHLYLAKLLIDITNFILQFSGCF